MGSSQNANNADTSTVSEAYAKMLTIFIPLLVDEVVTLISFSLSEPPLIFYLLIIIISSFKFKH